MASFSRASTGRNNNNLSPRTRRNQARARRTNGEVRRVGLAMGADEATVAIVDSWVKSNPYLIHQIEASFFFGMKLQYNFLKGNMNKDQVDTCKSLYGLSGDTDSDNGAANRQAAEGMLALKNPNKGGKKRSIKKQRKRRKHTKKLNKKNRSKKNKRKKQRTIKRRNKKTARRRR